jgi:acetyltransferase-like isoleucine patch superfamily enzyme
LLGVKVGSGCRILTRSFGTEPFLIKIGNNVTISNHVRFVSHDGSTWLIRDEAGRRYSYAPTEVGDFVFVGAGRTLILGVSIGDNVIVGAASIVTKSVPNGVVVAGNPAQFIGRYQDFAARHLAVSATSGDIESITGYEARVRAALAPYPRPMMTNPFDEEQSDETNGES